MFRFRPKSHGRLFPPRVSIAATSPKARSACVGVIILLAASTLGGCATSSPSLVGAWNREGTGRKDGEWTHVIFTGDAVTVVWKRSDDCRLVGSILKNTLRNVCTPQPDGQNRERWEDLHDGTIRMTDAHGVANVMKYDIKGDRLNLTGTAGGFDGDTWVFDRKVS